MYNKIKTAGGEPAVFYEDGVVTVVLQVGNTWKLDELLEKILSEAENRQ